MECGFRKGLALTAPARFSQLSRDSCAEKTAFRMNTHISRPLGLAALSFFSAGCFFHFGSRPSSQSIPVATKSADSTADSSHGEPPVRPYNKVITRDAKTRTGLLATHRVGDKLYFEIPANELNRDMLLVGRLARSSNDPSSGANTGDEFTERVLRWERHANRVVLRSPTYEITA